SGRVPVRNRTSPEHLPAGRARSRQEKERGDPGADDAEDMNTVIACGGTGGHLFPGLAVAEVLRARGHEVMLFVSEKEIDSLAMSKRPDFQFEKLPTVGFPSIYLPAIFGLLRRLYERLSI